MAKKPKKGTGRERVIEYLKAAGRNVDTQELVNACKVTPCLPAKAAIYYPHLVMRVRQGVYRYIGEEEKPAPEQKSVTQLVLGDEPGLFQVPALAVVQAAKKARPELRQLTDYELVLWHILKNRKVFREGRDYVGDGLDSLMLTERASRRFATMLKAPEVRSDIEESKARADGEDHVREFNMELLMPGTGPAGYPVSFDALIDALGLHRRQAIASLKKQSDVGQLQIASGPNGAHQYWLTEEAAKRFVLESGISPERKTPIYDYFIRREAEAQDYRQRDKQEQTALAAPPSSDFALLLARMDERDRRQEEWMRHMMNQQQQMMSVMMTLVERGTQQNVNIESYQALTTQLTISEQEKEKALLLKERAIEAVDETIGTHLAIKNAWPFDALTIARELGWFAVTGSGKHQARAVTSVIVAEGLAERGTGCGLVEEVRDSDMRLVTYKGTTTPTREGRLNEFGREVLKGLDAELRLMATRAKKRGVRLHYPGRRFIRLAFERSRTRIKDEELLLVRVKEYLLSEEDLTPSGRMYH